MSSLIVPSLIVLVFGVIMAGENQLDISASLFGLVLGPVCITVWLFLFNRGEVKLDARSLEIKDGKIIYSEYGELEYILINEYQGYEDAGGANGKIRIFSSSKSIGFYRNVFSESQNQQIFNELDKIVGKNC